MIIIYVAYTTLNKVTIKLENQTFIEGTIIEKRVKDNKLTLVIKNKEKIQLTYYFTETLELDLGDYVKAAGELSVPSTNTNFNLFSYQKYLLSKNIKYIFKAEDIEVIKKNKSIIYIIKNAITKYIATFKSKEYLNTFILGENDIEEEVKESYQLNGVSHLFAISGMHITLFSSILLFLFKKIIKNKTILYCIISIFLIFYSFLAGFAPSVVRGTLLFICLFLNKAFKINMKTYKIVLILIIVNLLYNPYYIHNTGFMFSYTISLFLTIYGEISNHFKNYFIKLFMVSMIAFLSSLPIVINTYYQINLLTPITNIIFVPIITVVIFPLSLITLIFPFFDSILNLLISWMESISLFVAQAFFLTLILEKISFIIVILYYILINYILVCFKRKKYNQITYLLVILVFHNNINYLDRYSVVTMIDVGQGDSILIQLPNNKGNILIDTGGFASYYETSYSIAKSIILPYLKSVGIKKLDYLITTHGDADHMGESINLVNNFKIDNIIFNCGIYNDLENQLIKILDKKNIKYDSCINKLNIEEYKFWFLNTKEYNNENDNSIVIYTELNSYKFLFMGDAGVKAESDILKEYKLSYIDFLKVGHHGSNTSSSEYFINIIKPKYSLISVGEDNKFGHPKEYVLDILKDSKIYRTDQNGSIEIKLNKNGYKIRTCSP